MQRVYLTDVGSVSPVLGVNTSALCIELEGEDLAGRVAVGTCLSVFGTAALTHQPDGSAVRAWTGVQVPNGFTDPWVAPPAALLSRLPSRCVQIVQGCPHPRVL